MALRLLTLMDLVGGAGSATGGRADERALRAADQRADAGPRGARSADDERRLFPGAVFGDTTLRGRRVAPRADAADTVGAAAVEADVSHDRPSACAAVHDGGSIDGRYAIRLSLNCIGEKGRRHSERGEELESHTAFGCSSQMPSSLSLFRSNRSME